MTVGRTWKAKISPKRSALAAQFAEHQLRAGKGILQELVDAVARKLQQIAAEVEAQDEEGKQELQKKSQDHGLDPDRAPVAGKQIGQAQHGDQAQKPCQTAHSRLPVMQF